MARQSNTEARRAEIVAAMLPVLARVGYEKATIQAIAGEAGLAPGLIHYHFRTKQEILISLVDSISAFARERAERAAADTNRPVDRLNAWLQALLGLGDGASPERVAAWVMIGAEAVRQPDVRAVYSRAVAAQLAELTELLSACLTADKRKTEGAARIAAGLLAMAEGAFQLSSATSDVMPAGYAAVAAIRFAALSMKAEPRAA